MANISFCFRGFDLDPSVPVLAFDGKLIKDVDRKTLEVLTPLVEARGVVVSHEEIITYVWKDNYHGITPARINQYISKLQKLLRSYDPETKFLENIRGRGYRFIVPVNVKSEVLAESIINEPELSLFSSSVDAKILQKKSTFRSKVIFAIAAGVFICLLAISSWVWFLDNGEKEIMRVVKESQLYESLVLYKNPTNFREADFDQFWTPELELEGNYDRSKIRQAVAKLVNEGRRYGDETKCEQFEFQSVEINVEKDVAVVRTLEKWFVAVYFTDGSLQKNKYIGPYFVSYVLKKIDGKWLIEKSTNARAIMPTPRLSKVEFETPPIADKQFFVNFQGEDLLHEVVHFKVIGQGCPEANPCKVSNSVLREYSKIQPTQISHVPLTLATGKFKIAPQNGDSSTGNFVEFEVP